MQHVSIMLGLFIESCRDIVNLAINMATVDRDEMEKGKLFSKLWEEIYSYRIVTRMLPIMKTYLVYLVIMPIIAWCVLPMIMQCGFLPYYIAGILIVAFIIADMLISSLQLMGAMSLMKEQSSEFENKIEIEDKIKKSKFYNEMKEAHQPALISFIHYLNFIKPELSPKLNINTVIDDILEHKIQSLPEGLAVYCRGCNSVILGIVTTGLKEDSSTNFNRQVLRYIPQTDNSVSSKDIQVNPVSSTQSNADIAGQNSLFSSSPSNKESFEDYDSKYSYMNAID